MSHPPTAPIRVRDHTEIVLSDGVVLSAMTWMPDDAEANPVPAILEYLPYPKRDQTAKRDALNHRYFASCGYACVRVDMRGAGDSEGVLLGEYLKQEQDDALEVLQWIAAQPWCTGAIGMIGISWGGFNGLQIAARRPPELKAVVSICSTDDRYAGDIHYMGGCLLVDNLTWGASMFAIEASPPDADSVGDKWRQLWLERLESGGTYVDEWHQRQRRDEFWDHASICEDYSAVECPVFVVGGWADPYHSSLFRMMKHLKGPKKGLVGPWGHLYPNFGEPSPQIGFLQEAVRWWDKWLKGVDNGITEEPMLRTYLQDTVPPQKHYKSRPGHWVAEESWPSPNIEMQSLGLAPGRLTVEYPSSKEHLSICSPQTVGMAAGKWLQFGPGPEGPGDQRLDAIGSLTFDTDVLSHHLDILGAPVIHLSIASDKPNACVAVTLSEVLPNGAATRISYGVFNLTHRDGDRHPKHLVPGQFYDVAIQINECGQRIAPGSRLRIAISSTYFPLIWTSPETVTLTIDCARSKIELPIRPKSYLDDELKPFEPPANGPALQTKVLREPKEINMGLTDFDSGEVSVCYDNDTGLTRNLDTNWCYGVHETVVCTVHPDNPLSARVEQRFHREFGVGTPNLVVDGWMKMTVDKTHFFITSRLDAYESDKSVFGRDYEFKIPRDHV